MCHGVIVLTTACFCCSLGVWPWYTLIDDKIYLGKILYIRYFRGMHCGYATVTVYIVLSGAIPLQSLHHLSHLTLDLGIK